MSPPKTTEDSRTSPKQEAEKDGTVKKPCKACCACPDTKRIRDECIVENGEENCQGLIEAHKTCMRKMGFNI